jgi:hypothetical protein
MSNTTRAIFHRRNVASAAASAAALVTPAAAMAATGDLAGAAIPVAFLLGLFLLALASYLASARALVERPKQRNAGPRAVGAPAASGAC